MKIFKVFVPLIATIVLCNNIHGQHYLLTEIAVDTTTLDSTQLANYQRSERSPYLTNHRFVSYHHLHEVQKNGAVKLDVSLGCDTITFFAEEVEYQDSSNFYWYGMAKHNADTAMSSCELGDFMILCDNSRLIGHMTIDTNAFELTHLGDTICLLSRVEGSMFAELECGTPDTIIDSSISEITPRDGPGNCNVRCLVLYTPAALEEEGSVSNLEMRSRLGIRQTNQYLKNSLVPESTLKIEMVGLEPLTLPVTGILAQDLKNLIDDNIASDLREHYEADIVVLLASDQYGDTYGRAMFPSTDVDAFCIVTMGATATATYTMAHEIYHLFGAGHDNNTFSTDARGYKFKAGWLWPTIFGDWKFTIMHRLLSSFRGAVRIPYISNPDNYYNGQFIGVENANDNVKQILATSCTVAQYEETVLPAFVSIQGNFLVCPCSFVSLTANIIGGTAGVTYSFSWDRSSDGINWTPVGSGVSHSLYAPCQYNFKTIWLRVTATGSNNTILHDLHSIHAFNYRTEDDPCEVRQGGQANPVDHVDVFVSPNPGDDDQDLTVEVFYPGFYTLVVLNSFGQQMALPVKNSYLTTGEYHYKIPFKDAGEFYAVCYDESLNRPMDWTKFLRIQ